MGGAGAPVTVLGAPGEGAGTRQVGGRYLGEACEGGEEGSCCSLVVDKWGVNWVEGMKKVEGEGLEGGQQVEGRVGGGMEGWGGRSWGAWGRMWAPRSSSWTADSGNLHLTCRSCWST